MDITKVTYKQDKLTIVWQKIVNGHTEVHSRSSKIEPHPDFIKAFAGLDKSICIESELPDTDDEYLRHNIIHLSCTYTEDGYGSWLMSASIGSERFMESTARSMKITSPLKPETGQYCLDSSSVEAIYKVLDEAKAYIGGKRHDLFAEAEVA